MVLSFIALLGLPSSAVPAAVCDGTFRVIASPNKGDEMNVLEDVVVTSESSAYAVGYQGNLSTALMLRWNGTKWSPVKTYKPKWRRFHAVDALGKQVWAVGSRVVNGKIVTLSERKKGSEWVQVGTPNIAKMDYNFLKDVDIVGKNDVWASGMSSNGRRDVSFVAHFDGSGWAVEDIFDPSDILTNLSALDAHAPDDIWGVGWYLNEETWASHMFAIHYDGESWEYTAIPDVESFQYLDDVVVVAPDNVWAVGGQYGWDTDRPRPLVMHYDGTEWSQVEAPTLEGRFNELSEVVAVAPDDIWAIGQWMTEDATFRSYVQHYDGESWEIVDSPNVGNRHTRPEGADNFGSTIWAVGTSGADDAGSGIPRTLTMNLCS